jgi:hypothetical protein
VAGLSEPIVIRLQYGAARSLPVGKTGAKPMKGQNQPRHHRAIDRSEAGWMLFARLLVWATRNNHRA